MKDEIAAAVLFLSYLIKSSREISPDQLDNLRNKLTALLLSKFKNHWYEDQPTRGQGYRCVNVDAHGKSDALLAQAISDSGLELVQLPQEMALWIDPGEVSCRFGSDTNKSFTIGKFNSKTERFEISDIASFVGKLDFILRASPCPDVVQRKVASRSRRRHKARQKTPPACENVPIPTLSLIPVFPGGSLIPFSHPKGYLPPFLVTTLSPLDAKLRTFRPHHLIHA